MISLSTLSSCIYARKLSANSKIIKQKNSHPLMSNWSRRYAAVYSLIFLLKIDCSIPPQFSHLSQAVLEVNFQNNNCYRFLELKWGIANPCCRQCLNKFYLKVDSMKKRQILTLRPMTERASKIFRIS